MMKSQTGGVVAAASEAARGSGMDFAIAYIDRPVTYHPATPFSQAYMDRIFALGYQEARTETLWHGSLPYPAPHARPVRRYAASRSRR